MNPLTGDTGHTIASPAYAARRCHCRPGCLTEIRPGDQVVTTPGGAVLREHLAAVR